MSENKTFFKELKWKKLTLREIFSDVSRKHTSEETAQVFIAGTPLTTPAEEEMLSGWQKPFLFARFFISTFVFLLCSGLFYLIAPSLGGYCAILGLWVLVPVSMLLLVWEMNIPRNISLYELIRMVAFGGLLSIAFTILFQFITGDYEAILAPITEEPAKLLIVYMIVRKKDYKFTLNGILIGMAVGTGFAIFEDFTYILRAYFNQNYLLDGVNGGIIQAFVRAITGIAGHGLYAALYGGALVMVKKRQPLSPAHVFSGKVMLYFSASFGLHMLNNSGLFDNVFASDFSNICLSAVVTSVIGIAFFLPLLRAGVNEVVTYVVALNNDSLTVAVGRREHHNAYEMAHHNGYNQPYQAYSAPRQIYICFTLGSERGNRYRSPVGSVITIGRANGCNLKVEGNSTVSKQHCKVYALNGSPVIVDLNSTNGTFVGARRLPPNTPTPVSNRDTVYLGKDCAFQLTLG